MGANISIFDVDKKKGKSLENKIIKSGYNAKFHYFDCTKKSNIKKNLQSIFKNRNFPETLINCSYPRTKDWDQCSFDKINLKRMTKNIEIHMNSYAWLSKIVADKMVKNKIKGSIINLNSIYGLLGQDLNIYYKTQMKENMPYSMIKGGLVNLTRQMASYYGRYGIRINSICSGGLKGHVAGKLRYQQKQFVKNYENKVPLKRLGDPDEVANVITFIASDASSYITGSNILVDGGWTTI